jgi:cobyrinic acid a,c-diamide synthase
MSDRPRLVIAAPQGRSGKTTLAVGLCAALKGRGIAIQPFKKGPDYIDPSWLSEAAGRPCYSLDQFFYPQPADLLHAFNRYAHSADLSLVEGNHGLFDSLDDTGSGSTAAVARTLQAPILLVVNAARTGRSVAAIVHGCQTFEPGTNIAGVVLNNVAHARHETRLRQAIESCCHLPVVGAIPRDERLTIPDRHLGLVPHGEQDTYAGAIEACRQAVETRLDLDLVLTIARSASPLVTTPLDQPDGEGLPFPRVKIGVLRDRAFSFYYPENLQALIDTGADLVFINSMSDSVLPPIDGLYIGGGFPEIFMQEISANIQLRSSIQAAVENDLPVYAECGGLMYLSRRITWHERSAEMAGVLPCEVEMTGKPQGHGYVVAQVEKENPFFNPGTLLHGHEFHNSRLIPLYPAIGQGSLNTAYHLARGNGMGNSRDGLVYRNVLASYTHLHVGGAPGWAEALVRRACHHRASQPLANRL